MRDPAAARRPRTKPPPASGLLLAQLRSPRRRRLQPLSRQARVFLKPRAIENAATDQSNG
jgi:hypothetical protein